MAEHITVMSKMLPQMFNQLSAMQEEQQRLQRLVEQNAAAPPPRASQMPVSMPLQSFAKMMGSPPRTKHVGLPSPPPKASLLGQAGAQLAEEELPPVPGGDTLAQAVLQQSVALTSLVAHLQQGGDPLLDPQGTASSTSSRGAAGRERLQKELAQRTGGFFLQVMQNAFRRMRPASQLPPSIVDLAATDFSMIQYLERCGGYGNARELGIIQYALAFVADAAMRDGMEGVREHLSLAMVAIEQAAQGQSKWDLAFQLTLLEDPPPQIFSYSTSIFHTTGRARAFSALCPQRWATVALAFAKEMDYIQSRRQERAKLLSQDLPAQREDTQRRRLHKARAELVEKIGFFPIGQPPVSPLLSPAPLPSSSTSVRASGSAARGRGVQVAPAGQVGWPSGSGEFDTEIGAHQSEPDERGVLQSLSVAAWPDLVFRNLLRSKTPFAWFVHRAILHAVMEF